MAEAYTGVLLAAGEGRRFGSHKLLARYRGQALVLHAAATLSPCDRVLAVVRADDHALQQVLRRAGIETVINEQAARGMGTSIACGVRNSADSSGWCILPADMPDIPLHTTRRIVAALRAGAPLAAPYHADRRGHPAGFQRRFAAALLALDGEQGARALLQQHADAIARIDSDDSAVVEDIDTPEDLVRHEHKRQARADAVMQPR